MGMEKMGMGMGMGVLGMDSGWGSALGWFCMRMGMGGWSRTGKDMGIGISIGIDLGIGSWSDKDGATCSGGTVCIPIVLLLICNCAQSWQDI